MHPFYYREFTMSDQQLLNEMIDLKSAKGYEYAVSPKEDWSTDPYLKFQASFTADNGVEYAFRAYSVKKYGQYVRTLAFMRKKDKNYSKNLTIDPSTFRKVLVTFLRCYELYKSTSDGMKASSFNINLQSSIKPYASLLARVLERAFKTQKKVKLEIVGVNEDGKDNSLEIFCVNPVSVFPYFGGKEYDTEKFTKNITFNALMGIKDLGSKVPVVSIVNPSDETPDVPEDSSTAIWNSVAFNQGVKFAKAGGSNNMISNDKDFVKILDMKGSKKNIKAMKLSWVEGFKSVKELDVDYYQKAYGFGVAACNAGKSCIPSMDDDLNDLITIFPSNPSEVIEAWLKGWSNTNNSSVKNKVIDNNKVYQPVSYGKLGDEDKVPVNKELEDLKLAIVKVKYLGAKADINGFSEFVFDDTAVKVSDELYDGKYYVQLKKAWTDAKPKEEYQVNNIPADKNVVGKYFLSIKPQAFVNHYDVGDKVHIISQEKFNEVYKIIYQIVPKNDQDNSYTRSSYFELDMSDFNANFDEITEDEYKTPYYKPSEVEVSKLQKPLVVKSYIEMINASSSSKLPAKSFGRIVNQFDECTEHLLNEYDIKFKGTVGKSVYIIEPIKHQNYFVAILTEFENVDYNLLTDSEFAEKKGYQQSPFNIKNPPSVRHDAPLAPLPSFTSLIEKIVPINVGPVQISFAGVSAIDIGAKLNELTEYFGGMNKTKVKEIAYKALSDSDDNATTIARKISNELSKNGMNFSEDSSHKDAVTAITEYTHNAYKECNLILRGLVDADADYNTSKKIIANIDKSFADAGVRMPMDLRVYRGSSIDNTEVDKLNSGGTHEMAGFTSTSLRPATAYAFTKMSSELGTVSDYTTAYASGELIKANVPTSRKGTSKVLLDINRLDRCLNLYVEKVSGFSSECELIINRGVLVKNREGTMLKPVAKDPSDPEKMLYYAKVSVVSDGVQIFESTQKSYRAFLSEAIAKSSEIMDNVAVTQFYMSVVIDSIEENPEGNFGE